MEQFKLLVQSSWKAIIAFLGAAIIPVLPVIQDELQTWAGALIAGLVTAVGVWLKSNTVPQE